MQLAGFRHNSNHLIEAFHVDFRLLGNDAAVRIKIKGQCLARDRFARSRRIDDHLDYFIAVARVPHEAKRRGEAADVAKQRVLVLLRPGLSYRADDKLKIGMASVVTPKRR